MSPPPDGRGQSSTRGARLPAPRRRFGQNFLRDAGAIARIVDAAAPLPDENVVEIGPGHGALTAVLLTRVPRLTAIELDRDLAAVLAERFGDGRLRLLAQDVLEVSLSGLGTRLVVVGNLPYNVSKPVAMKLVSERAVIARAVLMFQREVAERLVAAPGTSAYGPLTILAGSAFRIERLFDLPPGAFTPRPRVVSTVTRWTPRPTDLLPAAIEPRLRALLRASFARRRQTLLRNLRSALPGGEPQAAEILERAGIDGARRAEEVPPEAFRSAAAHWPETPR